jgi:beta-lactam-binding protein with PASTA domain
MVRDQHHQDAQGAQHMLAEANLKAQRANTCTGTDKGNSKTKKGRVLCQNPAAGQPVAQGTTVQYVLAGK